MPPPACELADIFRQYGAAYRASHPLPRQQLRVMRAIEICRTATLGGHIERCSQCAYSRIAYNSCRNRHCPKCQGTERREWLNNRQDDLLPVEYFHVVFTLPQAVAQIALQNKSVVYGILLRIAAETLVTIARDPKHLGAEIGFFTILHTWGQNLLHHPHAHCVVPGGGLSADGQRWISCRPGFFLPVKVLSRLFRRLFLAALQAAFHKTQLRFSGELEPLRDADSFRRWLSPLRSSEWVVYAKPPLGGASRALAYLSRYTHRVAISNERILRVHQGEVTFQWKDYRHRNRHKSRVMKVRAEEFMRRFLLHTLPEGFQRIRYFGFLANRHRTVKLALCRRLLPDTITALLPDRAICHPLAHASDRKPPIACPQCRKGVLLRLGFVMPCFWPSRPPDTS